MDSVGTVELERPDLLRRSVAEGLAAFALVFAGCGAAITNATTDGALGATGVAAVFGLIIMVMIYATGHLSGAHINPAVTIAFTLTRHFRARDAVAVGAGAAIAIGGTVALDALFGGPLTGASMNPARSFGPALASGTWTDFWIYVVGPVAGAALGALAYQFIRTPRTPPGSRA
jgi:glycerol uptake facilitator-like aquaporin